MARFVQDAVATISNAAAQWKPTQAIAAAISTMLRWLGNESVAVSITQSPVSITVPNAAAVALTGLASGSNTASERVAAQISTVADLGKFSTAPAAKIVQIKYDLTGTYGATSAAASHPSGSTDWSNPSNATGNPNASNATVASSLTAAVDAILTLSYAALPNKTALTITQVQVKFTASLTKSALGTPSLALRYSLNGTSYTTLQTITASNAGPFTFDITAAVGGNWTNLQTLKAQLEFTSATGDTGSSATCDAVEFIITASTTQVP